MGDCHICGRAVVPPDQTVSYPSCECHLDLARLSSENAALKSKLGDTRSGSQGVVTEEVMEFALQCIDGRIGLTENSLFAWSKSDRPEAKERILGIEREAAKQRAMRAALLAAMGGREEEWIVTKDRKPNDCVEVDAIWWGGDRKMAYRRNGVWWYYGQMGIKEASVPPNFWRPLPPPPTTISEERAR